MSLLPILLLCKTIDIIQLDILLDISNQFFTLFTVLILTLLLVNTKVSYTDEGWKEALDRHVADEIYQ